MDNLNEPVSGVAPAFLFEVAAAEIAVLLFILAYLWPIVINPHPDYDVPFYYPVQPNFWLRMCYPEVDDDDSDDE